MADIPFWIDKLINAACYVHVVWSARTIRCVCVGYEQLDRTNKTCSMKYDRLICIICKRCSVRACAAPATVVLPFAVQMGARARLHHRLCSRRIPQRVSAAVNRSDSETPTLLSALTLVHHPHPSFKILHLSKIP